MSPKAKDHAARVRRQKGGACGLCKRKKRTVRIDVLPSQILLITLVKCRHVLKEDKEKSSINLESADDGLREDGLFSF